ncbi:MAG TPA: hypothetical protein VHI32_00220 [Burkholderiales bacterium]|nr:hypothetical protein [Burkholderiales bacterium]
MCGILGIIARSPVNQLLYDGLLRGLVIVIALAMLAGLTPLPRSSDWKDSALGYSLAQTVIQLKPWLPPAFANRLKYN